MNVEKAYAISDAKIKFVSLVDKAANLQNFLITKADDGTADFTTYGKIIKTDKEHTVTGIVYEPMTEDAHGNYMTEAEIAKAQRWYAKNSNRVDIQHSFEPLENACVIENWIAKADCEIAGQAIKKGTWLMTVEITDDEIWKSIENGEITGFSMGGIGKYSEIDEDIGKSEASKGKGIFKKLADFFGFNVVEKGEVADAFNVRQTRDEFWAAWDILQETLYKFNPATGNCEFVNSEPVIRNALQDFSDIVMRILTRQQDFVKCIYDEVITKAGRKISNVNRERLQAVYENLGQLLADTEEKPKEEDKMTPELKKAIETIVKELNIDTETTPTTEVKEGAETLTKADIEGIVAKAITENGDIVTKASLDEAVEKALKPVLAATGLSSNLNSEPNVSKAAGEQHYMTGMF